MEVQLFDGEAYRLRVNASEPLWDVLLAALAQAGATIASDGSGADPVLRGDRLAAVVESVESELSERLRHFTPDPEAGYDSATITVLGRPLSIRVRDPEHYALSRVNRLHGSLAGIGRAGGSAHLYAVPTLSTLDHVIAGLVLAASPDGVEPGALGPAVRAALAELQAAGDDPEEAASLLRRSGNDTAIRDRVEELLRWGLAERGPDGAVRATEKLRTILR